ncbi:hypothetical protein [Streptomyces sp. NPDC048516]|uniref:hypothetical protein n=1 Tax=Streptomyces sp. NPDC048516 TaxID=3365565 RepID=UPI00370FB255
MHNFGRAANLALAGLPNFTLPSDISGSDRYYQQDLTEPFTVVDGLISVPTGPGIGIAPIPEVLAVEAAQAQPVLAVARDVAADFGLGELCGVSVGGGSDGTFTASIGVPTLDGLGTVVALAHAEGECVVIAAMSRRAALSAGLIDGWSENPSPRRQDVRSGPGPSESQSLRRSRFRSARRGRTSPAHASSRPAIASFPRLRPAPSGPVPEEYQ